MRYYNARTNLAESRPRRAADPPRPRGTLDAWKNAALRILRGAAGLTASTLGVDAAPADVAARRLAICDRCELSRPADEPVEKRRCGRLLDLRGSGCGCGCWVDKKTRLAGQRCPLDRW